MKQTSLANAGFTLAAKRTRKCVFLDEMNLVVPWANLAMLIEPYAPSRSGAKGGRPPFPVETILRIHLPGNSGSACLTRPCKKLCTTRRCTANLQG